MNNIMGAGDAKKADLSETSPANAKGHPPLVAVDVTNSTGPPATGVQVSYCFASPCRR